MFFFFFCFALFQFDESTAPPLERPGSGGPTVQHVAASTANATQSPSSVLSQPDNTLSKSNLKVSALEYIKHYMVFRSI